jgi:Ala-tRNA(Pro) deacylase
MAIATSVRSHLTQLGVPYEVIEHPHTSNSTYSAQAAHVSGDRVAKCVMLEDEYGYLMAVLPATRRVDLGALHRRLGRDLGLATESELIELFRDCEPGAVPPLGEAYGVDAIVDNSLVGAADVYFESGDHRALVHVSGSDFVKLMGDAPRDRISYARH